MPEFEKEEKLGREKAMALKETLCYEAFMRPQSFYVSQILKNELKTNNSSHLISKKRFHTRCFSKDKKIHDLLPVIFLTPRNSLVVSIIRTDAL